MRIYKYVISQMSIKRPTKVNSHISTAYIYLQNKSGVSMQYYNG